MAGIGSIGALGGMPGAGAAGAAGGNPLSGLGGSPGIGGGGLSGMGDLGTGTGTSLVPPSNPGGLTPARPATETQGASFTDALRTMVIDGPSQSKAYAGNLAARFAAGDTSIDPHQISIASAKAGVEVQLATRTISSAVSAVRTLFQMQV